MSAVTTFAAQSPSAASTTAAPTISALVTPTQPVALSLGILAFLGLPGGTPSTPANPALWTLAWFIRRSQQVFDNQAPTFDSPDVTNPSGDGKTFHIVVDADDADDDPLTYTVTDQPDHGTLTTNADGSYTYRANAGYVGTDSFTIEVRDDSAGSHLHGVGSLLASLGGADPHATRQTITVTATNPAPVASMTADPPDSDGVVHGTWTVRDPNGDPVTITAPQGSGTVTVGAGTTANDGTTTGTWTYRPTDAERHAAFTGTGPTSKELTFGYSDGTTTTPVTVTADIAPHNNLPTVDTSSPVGVVDTTTAVTTGTVAGIASDADHDPLTYRVVSSTTTDGGTVVMNPDGTFTYTPKPGNISATDTFDIIVADSAATSTTATVTVNADVNQAPTVSHQSDPADQGTGVVTGTVTGVDRDTPVGYAVNRNPDRGTVTIDPVTGVYRYTPTDAARHAAAGGGPTTDSFTVAVADPYGATAYETVTVTIVGLNHSPQVDSVDVTPPAAHATTVTGTIHSSDADSDPLTYEVTDSPASGTVVVHADGTFTYTPSQAAMDSAATGGPTTDTFAVIVRDGYGGQSAEMTVTVPIPPANRAPNPITSPTAAPDANGVTTGTVSTTDPDGDPITYTVGTGPVRGQVTLNPTTGAFTYTPNAAARHDAAAGGPTFDSFTVTASDGLGGTTTRTVEVLITPQNARPVVGTPTGVSTDPNNAAVTGTIGATDPDNDTVTLTTSGTTLSGTGSVTMTRNPDGTYTYVYTPTDAARLAATNGGTTTDYIVVQADDGHGGTAQKVVPVSVTGVQTTVASGLSTSVTSRNLIGPDGTIYTIRITGSSNGTPIVQLVRVAPNGTSTTTQIASGSQQPVGDPVITADGTVYTPVAGNVMLVTSPDGTTRQVATPGIVGNPTIGPDGRPYYASTSGGTTTITKIAADGTTSAVATVNGEATAGPTAASDGNFYVAVKNSSGSTDIYRVTPAGTTSAVVSHLNGQPVGSPQLGSDGTVFQTTQYVNVFGSNSVVVNRIYPDIIVSNEIGSGNAVGGVVVDGTTAYQRTETTTDGHNYVTTVTVISPSGLYTQYTRSGRTQGNLVVRDGYVYTTLDAGTWTQIGPSSWASTPDSQLWIMAPNGRDGVVKTGKITSGSPMLGSDGDIYLNRTNDVVRIDGDVTRRAISSSSPV